MGETPQVPVYAHWHECEGRYHASAQLKLAAAPDAELKVATFHEWDKSSPRVAAERCAELVRLFLDKNGVTDVTILPIQPTPKIDGPVA